jgi:hypothetical protein
MLERKAGLLREILKSEDWEESLRERFEELDEAFFAVLSANIEQAEAGGDEVAVSKLQSIADLALELLDERTPQSFKFINQLMEAQYPRETKKLLEQNVESVDDELLGVMELFIEDLTRRGEKKTARRLREIRDQARAIVEAEG